MSCRFAFHQRKARADRSSQQKALLAAHSSPTGRQMSNKPDSPSSALGDVLALALDRAVGSSMESLIVLRKSVRSYTSHQKSRGVPLDQVMRALATVLIEVEDERSSVSKIEVVRDPELARQLRAWCSADYTSAR